jgi:hypothetical protein
MSWAYATCYLLIFLTADYADPADAGLISQELRAVFVYLPEVGGTLLATCYLLQRSGYLLLASSPQECWGC